MNELWRNDLGGNKKYTVRVRGHRKLINIEHPDTTVKLFILLFITDLKSDLLTAVTSSH